MAKCRTFMRGLCISINVWLLVIGIVMIAVGFSSGYTNRQLTELEQWSSSYGMLVLRIFGPVTVVLSVLGVCAATYDIKPLLLVYSVLMFVEFIALMVVASPLIQVQAQMDNVLDEMFLNATPLYRAEPQFKTELNKLQASDGCCGLRSHTDWEEQIPFSCICTPSSSSSQPSVLANSSSVAGPCVLVNSDPDPLTPVFTEDIWVHSQPCGSVLKRHTSFLIKVSIGVISAFSTVMMAALALSLALGLEQYWRPSPVETTVDDYDRVKYQPKASLT